MRAFGTGTKAWILSSAFLFSCPMNVVIAQAAQADRRGTEPPTVSLHARAINTHATPSSDVGALQTAPLLGKISATRSYGISCVPYARQVSGMHVAGNAWQWWGNAAGVYARGDQPEPGSVLNFRPNGRMSLGHVAVITRVVNAREAVVDHANWPSGDGGRGGVSRNVAVVDVSEANNWSAVRVELGRPGTFGSVYPTYGFIYNRPDTGVVMASVARPAPQAAINPVPSDLRPVAERPWRMMVEEVAESPGAPQRRSALGVVAAAGPR